jgi:hypothetical protein
VRRIGLAFLLIAAGVVWETVLAGAVEQRAGARTATPAITAGADFSCALTANGAVQCWGPQRVWSAAQAPTSRRSCCRTAPPNVSGISSTKGPPGSAEPVVTHCSTSLRSHRASAVPTPNWCDLEINRHRSSATLAHRGMDSRRRTRRSAFAKRAPAIRHRSDRRPRRGRWSHLLDSIQLVERSHHPRLRSHGIHISWWHSAAPSRHRPPPHPARRGRPLEVGLRRAPGY